MKYALSLMLLAGSIQAGEMSIAPSPVLVPAGNLTSGPVASSILPSTVAYTSVNNTFNAAGPQTMTYGLTAGSATIVNGLTASSGTFTITGNTQYSIATSSGISVGNSAGVVAGFFVGNGGGITGLTPGACVAGSGAGSVLCSGASGTSAAIDSSVGGGLSNSVNSASNYSVIPGGRSNSVVSAQYVTIGSGQGNILDGTTGSTQSDWAVLGGGRNNLIRPGNAGASGYYAVIGGGQGNIISAGVNGTDFAFIGGGGVNFASATYVSIVGGNTNSGTARGATIGGGELGVVSALDGTIGGGQNNAVSGAYGTVPGGESNSAGGTYSFAAGRGATTTASGAFVWSDSISGGVSRTIKDEVYFKAQGGFYVASSSAVFDGNVTISSAVYIGMSVSSQAVGAAGAAVTALCLQSGATGKTYASGGGCDCSGAVAITAEISRPNCITAGCVPTGWTCQESGGTGGACIAYAMCSRAQ